MNPSTTSMRRLAMVALAAGVLFSAVGTARADAPGLVVGKDIVAAIKGGSVAFAGSQDSALLVAQKNASVSIIIDYPSGIQVIVGPKPAGPDGHLVYTWTIPKETVKLRCGRQFGERWLLSSALTHTRYSNISHLFHNL